MIKKKLAIDDVLEYFWTNSQVLIGYIKNTQKNILSTCGQQSATDQRILRNYTMEQGGIKDESSLSCIEEGHQHQIASILIYGSMTQIFAKICVLMTQANSSRFK